MKILFLNILFKIIWFIQEREYETEHGWASCKGTLV